MQEGAKLYKILSLARVSPCIHTRVVCVGGDGMFVELVHGLMKRVHRDNGMDQPGINTPLLHPQLPIGIIPAGNAWQMNYSDCRYSRTSIIQTAWEV